MLNERLTELLVAVEEAEKDNPDLAESASGIDAQLLNAEIVSTALHLRGIDLTPQAVASAELLRGCRIHPAVIYDIATVQSNAGLDVAIYIAHTLGCELSVNVSRSERQPRALAAAEQRSRRT